MRCVAVEVAAIVGAVVMLVLFVLGVGWATGRFYGFWVLLADAVY